MSVVALSFVQLSLPTNQSYKIPFHAFISNQIEKSIQGYNFKITLKNFKDIMNIFICSVSETDKLLWSSDPHFHVAEVCDGVPINSKPVVIPAEFSIQVRPLTRVVPPASFTGACAVTGSVIIIVYILCAEFH